MTTFPSDKSVINKFTILNFPLRIRLTCKSISQESIQISNLKNNNNIHQYVLLQGIEYDCSRYAMHEISFRSLWGKHMCSHTAAASLAHFYEQRVHLPTAVMTQ